MKKTLTTKADTATEGATTYVLDGEGAPKWRLEHSTTGAAPCAQADCKRGGIKIEKGELRIGTQQRIDGEQKYYRQWRHWGCATKHSIKGLKNLCNDDPEKVPGYERISNESRQELRRAMDLVEIPDKEFKDIRTDLVKAVDDCYDGEFHDAIGYKVEVTNQGRAGCYGPSCKEQELKILKGMLRLGILRSLDGEADTYYYKHWKCVSKNDLEGASNSMKCGKLKGLKDLPEVYKAAVFESLESGQAGDPPELEPLAQKTTTDTSDVGADMAETVPLKKRMIGEVYNNKAEVDNTDSKKKRGRKAVSTNRVGAPVVEPSQQLPTRRSSRIQGLDVGIVENDARGVLAPEKKRGRKPAASAATFTSFDGAMDTTDEPAMDTTDEPAAKKNKPGRKPKAVSTRTVPGNAPGTMRIIMSVPEKPILGKHGRCRRGRKANAHPANALPANTLPANSFPANSFPANSFPTNTFPANTFPANGHAVANPSTFNNTLDIREGSIPKDLGQGYKAKGFSKQSIARPCIALPASAPQMPNRSSRLDNFPRRSQPDDFRDLNAESIAEVRRTIALNTPKTKPKRY